MENRVLVLFLALTLGVGGLTGCARDRLVQAGDTTQPPVIEPDVERRDIEVPRIDTEDFEVGILAGQISVEDFGVNTVAGGRFAYHVTEGFFVELAAGKADTELTSFERLSGAAQLLTEDEREYSYYNVSLGYNIFPGEHFIGKNRAMNTQTYVIGGVGKTTFAGDDRFTINLGLGMRLMPLDWLAVHGDIRDHVFDIDLLGQEKTSHNLEATLGVTFFF
ncbi:MAG TPA: outer membrane beta-barrel domain-containing protein [Gammaproteobacteria bacterium]|nr:outer membrane beta-barrel domain-containing protein [Gammaproteobacteria bacterium]